MPTLQFKGKAIIWNHHLSVPYHALDSVPDLDFRPDLSQGDMIIEGDNLLALKALLPRFSGRIRAIVIDPPYNTGNEGWIYNDNVNSPLIQDWLGKEVGKDDLTRHDKWACMMTPRLKLLRDLLADNGVIFISIDDAEVSLLRELMNEVFGEENFIALLPTIMNLKGNQDEFAFAGTHEYTLVFAKNKPASVFYEFDIDDEGLDDWEEDELGFYKKGANLKSSGVNGPREKRPNLFFPILIAPDGRISVISDDEYSRLYDRGSKTFDDRYLDELKQHYEGLGLHFLLPVSDGQYMSWRWERMKILSEPHNIILVKTDEGYTIYKKQRPSLGELPSRKPKTIFYKPEYSSGNGTNELRSLLGEKAFQNPKPIQLIKDFVVLCSREGDWVLDSFAGSGTTAHAVLSLAAEGRGKRHFILVQMTESTHNEPDKNVCKDVTRERIVRAIDKFKFEAGFQYFRVGVPMDADSLLSGNLPNIRDLGRYIYHLCTGHTSSQEIEHLDNGLYFAGADAGTNIYILYDQDYDKLIRMALNLDVANILNEHGRGKRKIVYAPACFLDEDYLQSQQIDFVNIPYGLFGRE
ncbi:MAG: site-specific DNA-methyltransferase [Anaerolineae bacterium]|nr:site-specific DNA-methyltransferase [Anaerolineae bacterium]